MTWRQDFNRMKRRTVPLRSDMRRLMRFARALAERPDQFICVSDASYDWDRIVQAYWDRTAKGARLGKGNR